MVVAATPGVAIGNSEAATLKQMSMSDYLAFEDPLELRVLDSAGVAQLVARQLPKQAAPRAENSVSDA
ncbi:MAG: hypothetical protein CBD91_07630 [Phycisphaeraceae bacterium TMED231]|nr:MAG: hypothetical protein CBD91_07630 [Phycisphaeraceae bacterium TMED231]